MIYTCTTNPSLDYYLTIDKLKLGKSNRSDFEMFTSGGKGVNVSIVLNNFHIQSCCLGFLGGFTKDFYLAHISNYPNIQPLFTTINDNTRINIKLMDNQYETSLNAKGPNITLDEFEKFKNRLSHIYKGDLFVLSGNIENEIKQGIIDVIHDLSHDGVKIVLDTDYDVIEKCLDVKPFMIKLNDYLLSDCKEELDIFSKKLIDNGTTYVMYSNASKPSYLYSKDEILTCKNLADSLVNTTGSSDSLVAGFIYGHIRGADTVECFKYANAASLATTIENDLGSKEKIEELFNTIEVEKI